jgi:type IV secretion system protein VirB5
MDQRLKRLFVALLLAGSLGMATPARAGIPVIDFANLAQAIQQVIAWAQQYQQMAQQISQLRQTYVQLQQAYAAITGGRGMEALMPLSAAARNYLPSDYNQMLDVVNNASVTYSALASQMQGIMNSRAVLNPGQLAALSTQAQQAVNQGRRAAAMLDMLTHQAQQNSSQRFTDLQGLITAIGGAGDDKAVQDLQARIGAEQAMSVNEQTKLQALYQMAQAQDMQRQQANREGAVNQLGRQSNLSALTW